MNKKIFIAIFTIFLALIVVYYSASLNDDLSSINVLKSPSDVIRTPTSTESVEGINELEFSFQDLTYRANWILVENLEELSLHSNVEDQLTSSEALSKHKCKQLVNAGFVTKTNMHIGLFKSRKVIISRSIENDTFNGFLYTDENNFVGISKTEPKNASIGLQTGPILIEKGFVISLKLKNDKDARRVVAAINERNKLIFLIIYNKNSLLGGPQLSNLPSILEIINVKSDLNISDAINLDGGSHSVFKSNQVNLSEASITGGYFCIKS